MLAVMARGSSVAILLVYVVLGALRGAIAVIVSLYYLCNHGKYTTPYYATTQPFQVFDCYCCMVHDYISVCVIIPGIEYHLLSVVHLYRSSLRQCLL